MDDVVKKRIVTEVNEITVTLLRHGRIVTWENYPNTLKFVHDLFLGSNDSELKKLQLALGAHTRTAKEKRLADLRCEVAKLENELTPPAVLEEKAEVTL